MRSGSEPDPKGAPEPHPGGAPEAHSGHDPGRRLANRQIRDFTEGSIPRHLVVFAIPMLLGNLLQALYNTVDSIWVGRFLGANALAAVSIGFPIIFALIALVIGLTMATTTLVSQYFGARQPEQVIRTVNNSMFLLALLGALVSIVGVALRRPLLRLINTPPEVMDMASTYLAIFMAGLVAMFLFNAAGAVLRGLGDSRTPLTFLAYSTGLNIILDPLLIFGLGPIPAMGVSGAALATVISQLVSAVIALRYLYVRSGIVRYRPGTFRLDWQLTRLTFRIGFPSGIQQVLVSLSALVVSAFVNSFGATVVAGFGAAVRLDQFAFLPSMSVGIAVSASVSWCCSPRTKPCSPRARATSAGWASPTYPWPSCSRWPVSSAARATRSRPCSSLSSPSGSSGSLSPTTSPVCPA